MLRLRAGRGYGGQGLHGTQGEQDRRSAPVEAADRRDAVTCELDRLHQRGVDAQGRKARQHTRVLDRLIASNESRVVGAVSERSPEPSVVEPSTCPRAVGSTTVRDR